MSFCEPHTAEPARAFVRARALGPTCSRLAAGLKTTQDCFMLFTSGEFLFVYLPLTLALFFIIARCVGNGAAAAWLVFASFVFYAYWLAVYTALLEDMESAQRPVRQLREVVN